MFAYCNNNPINTEDPSGKLPWYLDGEGNENQVEPRHVVRYNVPLYKQDRTNLCWAVSMIMRQSFDAGIKLTDEEALEAAKKLGELYHPLIGWNHGLPFYKQGKEVICRDIEDLYFFVKAYGPVYAAYRKWNIYDGHIVLVTGVDLDRGYIYTNNPWGIKGAQNEGKFFSSFVNRKNEEVPGFWLSGIYIPDGEE